jgi:hypothetical protein
MRKGVLAALFFATALPAARSEEPSRKQVADLIAKLEKDPAAAADLVTLTGRDFGLRPPLWRQWLDGTSDQQLARIAERRRRAKELDEQWHEYARAVCFSGFRGDAAVAKKAQDDLDKVRRESTEPQAWSDFCDGLGTLVRDGNAANARPHFQKVMKETPLSHHAATADELAVLLGRMSEENKAWVEPQDVGKLTPQEKIKYYIHHLRNVQVEQISQPGVCHVLCDLGAIEIDEDARGELVAVQKRKMNAAIELKKFGKEAIPALIELLDDRRPIRSVGHWRSFWPERTLLRYQDAAIQILDDLLPVPFYRRSSTAAYLSNESPEVRYALIARVRAWHSACKGKTEPETLWIAVRLRPGIHPTLESLKKLAVEHKQRDAVLKELHSLYGSLHRVYRPLLAELMVELGDESNVGEVREMLEKKEFQKYAFTRFPDDSAVYLNAQDAAKRLVEKYGKKPSDPE